MSSSDRPRGTPTAAPTAAPAPARAEPAAPSPTKAQDPYGKWLDRMQRARARHATITKNLHTWSNYKSWADQVKDTWDDENKKK